jgi:hypothetical protein
VDTTTEGVRTCTVHIALRIELLSVNGLHAHPHIMTCHRGQCHPCRIHQPVLDNNIQGTCRIPPPPL